MIYSPTELLQACKGKSTEDLREMFLDDPDAAGNLAKLQEYSLERARTAHAEAVVLLRLQAIARGGRGRKSATK